MKTRTALLTAAALALGCAGGSAYQKARTADTPDAYRAFLAAHPDDRDADGARARLADLEFQRASQAHTVVAYKRYLDQFPDSAKSSDARKRLEALRFNAALARDNGPSWRDFLSEEPDGSHRDEARKRLAEAEVRELAAKGDLQHLAERVDPSDPRYATLQAKLDDRRFTQAMANGTAQLLAYLSDFPAGTHRRQAEAELLSRKLEGMLFSGMVEEAKLLAAKSPLGRELPGLPERIARAEADAKLRQSPDPLIQKAQAGNYLRPLAELVKAMRAPDPLDRWQAAEEIGQHLDIRAIDPLLATLRSGRNALLRERAFESLRGILAGLPRKVADYETATRIEALRKDSASPEMFLTLAVLEDLSGELDRAAVDYQRAFQQATPDPVILRRWSQIREERGEPFSAAVAARQLSLWAKETAAQASLSPTGGIPLASARDACAAVDAARFASQAIRRAATHRTEFPEDLQAFTREADEALRLSQAKLEDAEILLRTQQPGARTCDDASVRDRLEEGVTLRLTSLRALSSRAPTQAKAVWRLAAEADPSGQVRQAAKIALGHPAEGASSSFTPAPGPNKVGTEADPRHP